MEAIFKVKNVYGNDLIYPINVNAAYLTSLTRKRTVDQDDLRLIRALGYNVIIN